MTIRYLGFTAAGLLFLLSLALLVAGIYNEIRDSYRSQSPGKPSRSSIRHWLWSAISFGSSLFLFVTAKNGFDWHILSNSIFFVFLLVFFIGLHYFVRRKAATARDRESIAFASPSEIGKDEKTVRKADLDKEG